MQSRGREEWVTGILEALEWLGMAPDEGPYRQSERSDRYKVAGDALGKPVPSTPAIAPASEIESRTKDNPTPGYDGFCREQGTGSGGGRLEASGPRRRYHDRLGRHPGGGDFPNSSIEDFVVVKSTGAPLFVFANSSTNRDRPSRT